MKKLILLALTAVIMAGCKEDDNNRFSIKQYDSCEYIYISDYTTLTHKGNCRFCAERRKRELQSIVEQLKEK